MFQECLMEQSCVVGEKGGVAIIAVVALRIFTGRAQRRETFSVFARLFGIINFYRNKIWNNIMLNWG